MAVLPRRLHNAQIDPVSLDSASQLFTNHIEVHATTEELVLTLCVRRDLSTGQELDDPLVRALAVIHLTPIMASELAIRIDAHLDDMQVRWSQEQEEEQSIGEDHDGNY